MLVDDGDVECFPLLESVPIILYPPDGAELELKICYFALILGTNEILCFAQLIVKHDLRINERWNAHVKLCKKTLAIL